jgi:peroxiredoxin Q/BCP
VNTPEERTTRLNANVKSPRPTCDKRPADAVDADRRLSAAGDLGVCDAYGVWGPTKWGNGIRRTTVIVGADGGIKKVFDNVSPEGHAAEVLAALQRG